MSFFKEFKEFAVKDNVMDLAVGMITGGVFAKIIDSVVKDLLMPLIAAVTGSPGFSNACIAFVKAPKGTPLANAREMGAVFASGNFIILSINFLLLALAVFPMVRTINKFKREIISMAQLRNYHPPINCW